MTAPTYQDSATTLDAEPISGDVIDVVNAFFDYELVAHEAVDEDTVLSTEGVAKGLDEALAELRELKGRVKFERIDDWFVLYVLNRWYIGYERKRQRGYEGKGWSAGRLLT